MSVVEPTFKSSVKNNGKQISNFPSLIIYCCFLSRNSLAAAKSHCFVMSCSHLQVCLVEGVKPDRVIVKGILRFVHQSLDFLTKSDC